MKFEYSEGKIIELFSQVLEMVDAEQQLFESKKKLLVLVLDGVDKLDFSLESFESLVLKTPKTVKIIYSCNRDTEIYKFLKSKLESEINAELLDPSNKFSLVLYYSRNYLDFPGKILKDMKRFAIPQNALYLRVLYYCLSTSDKDVPSMEILSLDSFRTVQSLFEYCIEVFSHDYKKIYKVFGMLALSNSGLSDQEIMNFTDGRALVYLKFFSFIVFKSENRSFLTNSCFKSIIFQKFLSNPLKFHAKLANELEKTNFIHSNTVAYHIFHSKDMIRLKFFLSKIPVFVQLFENESKIDLFMYWQSLQTHKIDPVECYSKSLETFSSINQLPPQDLSILLVLFTVFFKELSQYEENREIKFRHPLLVGHYDLKEIDLLDEFERLGSLVQSMSKNDEIYLKDQKNKGKKRNSSKKLYNLKRWLWIQFPWCSLDVHSNFSQILQVLESEPEKHEKEFFDSISRILKNSGLVYSEFKFKSTESKLMTTTSSTVYTRPTSNAKNLFKVTEKASCAMNSSMKLPQKTRVFTSNFFKNSESLTHLSFTGIRPENSLEYVQNNFIKFSKVNIVKKHQDSMNLQKIYNEKVQEYLRKKSHLEAISSQIDYSNTEIMAQQRSIKKIFNLQSKFKDMCKKINKIEAEGLRYKQIIGSCFKNPAKNDEWERSLINRIESMKKTIENERKNRDLHKAETFEIASQLEEFRTLSDVRLKSQYKTFEIVLSQFLIKVKLNEQIINEDAERSLILNGTYEKTDFNKRIKLRKREERLEELLKIKERLRDKLKIFKAGLGKLEQVSEVEGLKDLDIIMLGMNKRDELIETKEKLEKSLKNLDEVKNSLKTKLEYIKKQEYDDRFFSLNEKIENLVGLQKIAERKVEHFYNLTKEQDILLTTCKEKLKKIGYPLNFKRKSHQNKLFK